ncbi:MAG TPA: amidohydrolase family protein, partial [Methylophilaceae bacterium]|nr:amidohydrolase family protein [Methylophilaceae bacterium]
MTESTLHTPQNVDLAICARWVIPVVPHGQILEDTAVIVDAGRIIDLLPQRELSSRYQPAQTIQLPDHALIPGLINLHTHAGMTLMRGLADDLPLMQWLNDHIWPAEKRVVSQHFVRDSTLLGSAEMLAGGVTCFNEMYFYPQAAADAVQQAGIRANLGLIVLEFPTAYAHDADDYLQKGLEIRDGWRGEDLISASLAPHAPYTISDATFAKV